jgi:hypothetical protein
MNQEKTERYLLNLMTPVEKAEFEHQMNVDAELKNEVEELQLIISGLKKERRSDLKTRLTEVESQITRSEKSNKPSTFLWIFAIIVILALIGIFFTKNLKKGDAPVRVDSLPATDDSIYVSPPDIVPVETLIQKKDQMQQDSIVRQLKKSEPEYDQLFAAHFEPYTNEELENGIRGGDDKSNLEIFKLQYINGKYQKAITVFDSLTPSIQKNDEVLLLKANAMMALKDIPSAIPLLTKICNNNKSVLQKDACWYLLLCQLKSKNADRVKELLDSSILQKDPRAKSLRSKL